MEKRPLFKESLMLLRLNCLNPYQDSLFDKIVGVVWTVAYMSLFFNIFLNVIWNFEGVESLDGLMQLSILHQISSKMITLIYNRTDLSILLRDMETNLWPVTKYDNEFKRRTYSTCKSLRLAFFSVIVSALLGVFVIYLKPIFSTKKILPLQTYYPVNLNNSINYISGYSFQILMVAACGLPNFLGFDFLFIAIVTYINNELKLIKQKYSTLLFDKNEDVTWDEVKTIINHHGLILGFVNDVNRVYSKLLLNQFLTCTVCICTGCLGIIANGISPSLKQFLRAAPIIATFASLLFLYCLVGTLLMNESESVADAVFESKWWIKTQPKIRRALILSIQRAHKTEKVTAAGMCRLDLISFTSVIRSSFSLTMLAQALLTKKQ